MSRHIRLKSAMPSAGQPAARQQIYQPVDGHLTQKRIAEYSDKPIELTGYAGLLHDISQVCISNVDIQDPPNDANAEHNDSEVYGFNKKPFNRALATRGSFWS